MTWRPRYSLRTLAVFLLLVTSGMGFARAIWALRAAGLVTVKAPATVTYASFARRGAHVLTGHADGGGGIWDTQSGRCSLAVSGHKCPARYVGLSRDGKWLLMDHWDHVARICRTRDGSCRATLTGHQTVMDGCEFSSDGKLVGTNSGWMESRIWDAETGECLLVLSAVDKEDESARVTGFSEDGSTAFTVSSLGSRKRVDLATGQATYLEQASAPEPTDLRRRVGDRILIRYDREVVVEDTQWPRGVFWLWEFWLTAAFAGLFVWSVVRDRRALGKARTGEAP